MGICSLVIELHQSFHHGNSHAADGIQKLVALCPGNEFVILAQCIEKQPRNFCVPECNYIFRLKAALLCKGNTFPGKVQLINSPVHGDPDRVYAFFIHFAHGSKLLFTMY